MSFGKERLEQTGKNYKINGEDIKARKKTNNKWFETQDSISYWEDFYKPKIMYQELTQGSAFCLDRDAEFFISNTGYLITGNNLNYLITLLNSRIIEYCFRKFYSISLGESGLRWLAQYIINLPIPILAKDSIKKFLEMNDQEQESYIFQLLDLSNEEIKAISESFNS